MIVTMTSNSASKFYGAHLFHKNFFMYEETEKSKENENVNTITRNIAIRFLNVRYPWSGLMTH